MMLIIFIFYVMLCIYGTKLYPNANPNYMSKETTTSIKGIFILLVFFSHFNSYVTYTNQFDLIYYQHIGGQTMVTLFLFYSGYGVMESIKKKKESYINSIPSKRFLSTLFNFDCAVILFLILGLLRNETFSFNQIALSFIGWDSLGNSNWYIFVILLLYIITYFIFKLIKHKNYLLHATILLFTICVLVYSCIRFNIKPYYWYDTALCYVFGVFYSLLKEKVDTYLKHNLLWFIMLVASTIMFFIIKSIPSIITNLATNLIFPSLIILTTMRFNVGNKILQWFGQHLFEIYILQRIPMIIFKDFGIDQISIYFYFVLSLVFTVILTIPFRNLTSQLWNIIQKFIILKKG